jgi:magnesium transporter
VESAWVHAGDGWATTPPDGLLALLAAPEPPAAWVHVDSLDAMADAARQAGVPESVVRRSAEGGITGGGLGDPRHPQLRRLPGGGRYLVCPTLAYDPGTRDVTTGVWAALVVDDVTITAEEGPADLLDEVLENLRDEEHLPQDRPGHVFAAVLTALVRRAGDVEVGVGEAVADVEQVVFTPQADDPAEVVYDLKREIAEARRALVPLLSAFPELVAEQEDSQRETRTMRWIRRLDTVLTKVDRHLDAHDALLGDMLSVHLSRVSVRQNEDMRKISGWAAIIAVPTLVAGIYGMNFDHMPELHWLLGYPLSVLLMAGSATVLYRLFRRSGWL